jgi:hypothetical protein
MTGLQWRTRRRKYASGAATFSCKDISPGAEEEDDKGDLLDM